MYYMHRQIGERSFGGWTEDSAVPAKASTLTYTLPCRSPPPCLHDQVSLRKGELIEDLKEVLSGFFRIDPSGVTIRGDRVFNTPQVG